MRCNLGIPKVHEGLSFCLLNIDYFIYLSCLDLLYRFENNLYHGHKYNTSIYRWFSYEQNEWKLANSINFSEIYLSILYLKQNRIAFLDLLV